MGKTYVTSEENVQNKTEIELKNIQKRYLKIINENQIFSKNQCNI